MEFTSLNKFLTDKYYAVPDYQRDFEWKEAQASALIEDVFNILDEPNARHFIGALVTVPFEENCAMSSCFSVSEIKQQAGIYDESIRHVVDGQQRLTTLSIMLAATYNLIKQEKDNKSFSNTSEEEVIDLMYDIRSLIFSRDKSLNKSGVDIKMPKLFLNGNSGACFYDHVLNIGKGTNVFPTWKNFNGAVRIQKIYKFFQNQILEKSKEYGDKFKFYSNLESTIISKLQMVDIDCPNSFNAFQVFDSLNGKGLDLTAADRIKNIIFSWGKSAHSLEV